MLIVGRDVGQSVIIGDVVKVTVLQFRSKVRLAIDASKQFRIYQVKQDGSRWAKLNKRAKIIGDTTLIGDFIKVTILQTESGLLHFGIDAPKEISIYREELYDGKHFLGNQNVQSL